MPAYPTWEGKKYGPAIKCGGYDFFKNDTVKTLATKGSENWATLLLPVKFEQLCCVIRRPMNFQLTLWN